MHYKQSRILFLLGLLVLTLFVATPQAQAFTLEAENEYNSNLSIAVLYYDDDANAWVTRGWYNVPPGSTKRFSFKNSNGMDYAFLYAKRGNQEWYPSNYDDGNDFLSRTVIGNAFKYYDGEECPAGPNRRAVAFSKTSIDNGMIRMSWQ